MQEGMGVLRSVEIGVTDVERSADFYFGALGFSEDAIELVEVPEGTGSVTRTRNRGLLHVAWSVASVDREAGRVREAGVQIVVEPKNGRGVERLMFVADPDGTRLELVQGHRSYHDVISPEVAEIERAQPLGSRVLDHVAIGAASLGRTLAFYAGHFRAQAVGAIHLEGPTLRSATHLRLGGASLEIFTDASRGGPPPSVRHGDGVGIRSLRVDRDQGPEEVLVDPDGVSIRVGRAA